jgi:hypothetical protein
LQLLGVATVPASLELIFVVDFDVSYNYGQVLFMYISTPTANGRLQPLRLFSTLLAITLIDGFERLFTSITPKRLPHKKH